MSEAWQKKLKGWSGKLSKLKFPIIILAIGLVLILIPFGGKEQAESVPQQTEQTQPEKEGEEAYCRRLEAEISEILSQMEGAGRVKVMLTLKSSRQTQYQSDYNTTSQQRDGEQSSTTEQKTVLLSRSNAYIEAAVVKTEYPAFQGALVVSEGAKDATVRLELVNAVAALLGLGTDKITVVKMK